MKDERVKPARSAKTALLDHRGRARRHIRRRPDRRRARTCARASPGQTPAHHREGAGHYGIFSGRRWREVVYPDVRDFIAKYAA
jgi:poly(3-hydroxybutyrate) depolymerase